MPFDGVVQKQWTSGGFYKILISLAERASCRALRIFGQCRVKRGMPQSHAGNITFLRGISSGWDTGVSSSLSRAGRMPAGQVFAWKMIRLAPMRFFHSVDALYIGLTRVWSLLSGFGPDDLCPDPGLTHQTAASFPAGVHDGGVWSPAVSS